MNSYINQKICLKEFIPVKVICKNNHEKSFDLNIIDDEVYLTLCYTTELHNQKGLIGNKHYTLLLPKYIKRNKKMFEVLGLLQAEMGKQHDGKIVFCNHEYQLVNKVIRWFEDEFNFSKSKWKWYIKVNINEPFDQNYKQKVEDKTITHWISRTGLSLEQSYPKKVSYIKNTKNTKIGFYDYGTLIIESGSNLFSQFIKNLVKNITHNILDYEKNEVRHFMRGIIGGESCIEIDTTTKKFRVHISATDDEEKLIYHNCFNKLGIFSIIYKGDKLVISKKENNLELLKQKLMTLSPEKYNKFLRMIKLYEDFEGLKEWRSNLQKPWNKIPEEKINAVIGLHKEHPDWPAWKIAEQVCISNVKVSRVRKELEIDQNRQKLFK